MKKSLIILLLLFICEISSAQLAVVKLFGKNSENAKIGFGTFATTYIPINEYGNQEITIELIDLALFPPKDEDLGGVIAYLSIKAGFRYIFSEEGKTGFYIQPSAGFSRVVRSEGPEGEYKDGLALAFEGGHSWEVGQRGNALNAALKYETTLAGEHFTINSIAFRLAYSFRMFGGRN